MKLLRYILYFLLILVALPAVYIAFDYIRFARKPINSDKNILIISENLEHSSARSALVALVEKTVNNNARMKATVCDVTTMGLSFISGEDTPAEKPITHDPAVNALRAQVNAADGIIFVVPNFNGGYPAGIKNAIDLLWKEWFNKPVGFVTSVTTSTSEGELIQSFNRVLRRIKCDPVAPIVSASAGMIAQLQQGTVDSHLATQMQTMVDELYAETNQRHYFRQLSRSVTNKLLVSLIKFMKPKKQ